MELGIAFLAFCGVLVLLSAGYHVGSWRQRQTSLEILSTERHKWRKDRLRLLSDIRKKDDENIALLNSIDDIVEQRLRDWWPDPKDFDEQFKIAEQMHDRRRMRDAGRKTLPRSDAAPPARLHKQPISLRRSKPANPK